MDNDMGKIYKKRLGSIRFHRFIDNTYDWEALEKSLYYEGYQPAKYGYITVHNNLCVNGNHRLQILTRVHENLERAIWVEEVNNWSYFTGLCCMILLFPIYIPYGLTRWLLYKVGILKPKLRNWKASKPWLEAYRIKSWKQ